MRKKAKPDPALMSDAGVPQAEETTGIPYQFKKYGDLFTMQCRNKHAAMYHRQRNGRSMGYEVVMIQNRPDGEIKGKVVKGGECLPSSSQWGVMGWSFLYSEEERAKEKFASVCKLAEVPKEEKRQATVKARTEATKVKVQTRPEKAKERRIERRIVRVRR